MDDAALITGFISAIAAVADEYDEYGQPVAAPILIKTPQASLDELYRLIPGRLPRLFERLLLSYRWPKADLETLEVLPNPPGPGLEGFAQQPFKDEHLAAMLLPARLVQFARAGGGRYDPVCFDLRTAGGTDCPIVRIDHEEILCNFRIGPITVLAPSFRALVADLGRSRSIANT
jgi:hypothetical protein